MLPAAAAARILLPAVSVIYVIYRYLRSEAKTEHDVSVSGDRNDVVARPPNSPPSPPHPAPSNLDLAILDVIRKLDPAVLDDIRKLDPSVVDNFRKLDPTVLDGIRRFDPAVVDAFRKLDTSTIDQISKLCLNESGEEEDAEENCNGREIKNENENEIENENENSDGRGSGGRPEYPGRPGAGYYIHPGRRKNHQYFRPGGDKYGKAPSFNDNIWGPSVASTVELNFLGLPIRPEEKNCSYYMRTASCKYGTNCKFNHPDPTDAGESEPPFGYGNGGPASVQGASSSMAAPWSAPRSSNDRLYEPMMIPPSQGIPSQNTDWNGYQAPAYLPERSMPAHPQYVTNNPVTETNVYKQYPQQKQVEEFPERPGQPFCSYFLRKGDCKFKSNCKYDHPKTLTAASPSFTLSDKGLPLRPAPAYLPERSMPAPPPYAMNNSATETVCEQYPQQKQVEELPERPGQPVCTYFSSTGEFKSNCKYHHPKERSAVSPSCPLSDKGLPLRPGLNICTHYSRYGICNSGAACKFDHPSLSTFFL